MTRHYLVLYANDGEMRCEIELDQDAVKLLREVCEVPDTDPHIMGCYPVTAFLQVYRDD